MQLKILQLNINAGSHLVQLQAFLASQDFDICCFQEVAGAGFRHNVVSSDVDTYKALQQTLQARYEGELAIASFSSSDPVHGFHGNAIFYRKTLKLVQKNILTLSKGLQPFPSEYTTFEEVGRNALHLTLSQDDLPAGRQGKVFDIINAHLPWAPTPIEQPYQSEQNNKLIKHIASLHNPFVLTGDFNLTPDQPTVLHLEKYAQNLTKEYKTTNTLDRKYHSIFEKVPSGIAVDYIFVSPQIQVIDFQLIDEGLSDHLGLAATLSF